MHLIHIQLQRKVCHQIVPHLILKTVLKFQVQHRVALLVELGLKVLLFDADTLKNHGQLTENVGVDVGCHENAGRCQDCLYGVNRSKVSTAHRLH